VLTSSCNRRWKGIRVNGTTGNTLQSATAQGVLNLNSSRVENAVTGVWAATVASNNSTIGSGFGGRVQANNSLFLNNITGVKLESYHRFTSGGTPLANLSYFNNCDFVTNAQWPDWGVNFPKFHAHLQQVDRIRFTNCSFRNDSYVYWTPTSQWGIGIFATSATVNCTGNSDYANNRFANLNAGAMLMFNLSGVFINKVDGMGFANNMVGLYDWSDSDAWITRNKFVTNQLAPNPPNLSAGMFIFASEGYTVERNSFFTLPGSTSLGCGIWFRGPAYYPNRIYDNLFDGNFSSCVVEGKHGSGQAWTTSGTQGIYTGVGLELLCNDHNNTIFDHFLSQGYTPNNLTSIRNQQGIPGSAGGAANNRFFTPRVCTGNGPTWDIWAWPFVNSPLHTLDIEYVYLNNGDPVLRPRCIHQPAPTFTPESVVDIYYDLRPGYTNQFLAFDKVSHCAEGDLDASSSNSSYLTTALMAKNAELASAIAVYQGTVDGGDAPDLYAAINQNNPWYASHSLRDLLLAQSPLSDDVLKQVIQREQPMDPWHLTQVLIANSELSSEIWGVLVEASVLTPYFITILRQYDQNVSLRQLLEQEIALRNKEKARIQHQLVSVWAEDSVTTGRLDSLNAIYSMDAFGLSVVPQYWLAIERGDAGLAGTLGSVLGQYPDMTDMVNFGNVIAGLDGDVRNASASELAAFEDLAFDTQRAHNALGWAALWATGQTDSLPPMVIPAELRSAIPFRPNEILVNEPVLGAFPNPTSDRVMITLPEGLEESVLEVVDPLGRTVHRVTVSAGTRGVELDLDQYPSGLYIARLDMAGLSVGEVKFSLVR
jgi:hypothetical protein